MCYFYSQVSYLTLQVSSSKSSHISSMYTETKKSCHSESEKYVCVLLFCSFVGNSFLGMELKQKNNQHSDIITLTHTYTNRIISYIALQCIFL